MTKKNWNLPRAAFEALHREQLEIIAGIADVAAGLGKEEQTSIREHIRVITGKGSQELNVLAGELKSLGKDNHSPQRVSGRNLSSLPAIKQEGLAVVSAVNQELSSFLTEISERYKSGVANVPSSRFSSKPSGKSR